MFFVVIGSYSLNVFLHSLGYFLLCKTYKWSQVTTQQLILFNLSVAEGLFSLLALVEELLDYFLPLDVTWSWAYFRSIFVMLHFVIYFTMLFMTLDRLSAVALSFKYQLYWRVGRTKKVLATIWFVGFMLGVCTCVILIMRSIDIQIIIVLFTAFRYCQFVSSTVFVVTALSTYAVIFWKYRKSRNELRSSGSSNENGQQNSRLRFRIPALIIFTFVLFDSFPLCIWVISYSSFTSWSLLDVSRILYALGYMADALIYIFLQREVRKQLFSCCNKQVTTEPSSISIVAII